MILVVEIPLPTLSLNKLQRMHWAERAKLRDQYEQLFRMASSPLHRCLRREFRAVKIERHAVRLMDHDNFVGGCKPLVDALVRTHLIWDDSPEYVEVNYVQVKKARREIARCIVTIG